ncbi:MAG: HlyC/CorC family transporter [Anaerolineae bacterium]|jgi:CBS domain containing-hemolysin-like protein|nr:HlyC/CorC family transporter [Anaerolineae bacterium]
MTIANILLILVLVALNGFFVAVEFAAVSSRRTRLDLLATPESRSLATVHTWLEQPKERERLIAATQLGITVVSLALGAVGENAFEAWLEPYFQHINLPGWLSFMESVLSVLPLALSLVIVTSIHVVFGEQVPKVAILRAPEKFIIRVAGVMSIFISVFKWFINLLDWATRAILRLIGIPDSDNVHTAVTLEELKQIVTGPEVEGIIKQPERDMLSAVIDFGAMVVRQVNIPRTEIVAIEESAALNHAIDLMTTNNITKLPLFAADLDHITGILHLRDVVPHLRDSDFNHKTSKSLAREALFVPETISVNDLLRDFRDHRTHVAIVLDEFGGTAGLVTLEDLLEEIIGEVSSPFDAEPEPFQVQSDGSILIDGMTFIEDVNQYLDLHLVDEYYDTIAGFMLSRLGRIPDKGDTVVDEEGGVVLKVQAMDRLRIAQVLLNRSL